jgi:hypothetical protein
MIVERTEIEIILRISSDLEISELQRLFSFLKYREATNDSKATDEIANELSDESKKNWWAENKHRFIK